MTRWLRYFFQRRLTNKKAVIQYETAWYIRFLILLAAFVLGALSMVAFFKLRNIDAMQIANDTNSVEAALAECQSAMQNNKQLNATIEEAQYTHLSEQIEQLQAEKRQLREDLAVCNRLTSPTSTKSSSLKPGETKVEELTLHQVAPGVYKYTAVVAHSPSTANASRGVPFEGSLFLSVDLIKTGKTIVIAGKNGIVSPPIDLKVQNTQQFTGSFRLNANQKIQLFRARIRKNGRVIDTRTTNFVN